METLPDVILLCGFSGSGKTETGKELAENLGYGFTDTDATVEEALGKSIPEIFAKLGEGKFRFAESDVMRMAFKKKPQVISLGGGTIADDNNLKYVKSNGYLIYLRAGVETVYERLRDSHLRPMLQAFSREEDIQKEMVIKRIKELMQERETYYLKADLIIDTDGKAIADVAGEIGDALKSQ
jgi:shikimate kinase